MEVELLNNTPTGGIHDLTGGSNEPEQEDKDKVLDANDQVVDGGDTEEPEGGESDVSDGDAGDSDVNPDDEVDADKKESEGDEPELYFAGNVVTVDVPDEVSNALKDAGIEVKELVGELFKKDGDFSLPEEMRTKLEEKFGKTMVDGYLSMYKTMNEQTQAKAAAEKEAAEADATKRGEEYAAAVGGEEGLVQIEDFVIKNFDENQITAYNTVMESESHEAQLLVISQVKKAMELNDKLVNGDRKAPLVGDKDSSDSKVASPLDKGFLTNEEYNVIMDGDKYWTDRTYMAAVDNARVAGMRKGK